MAEFLSFNSLIFMPGDSLLLVVKMIRKGDVHGGACNVAIGSDVLAEEIALNKRMSLS